MPSLLTVAVALIGFQNIFLHLYKSRTHLFFFSFSLPLPLSDPSSFPLLPPSSLIVFGEDLGQVLCQQTGKLADFSLACLASLRTGARCVASSGRQAFLDWELLSPEKELAIKLGFCFVLIREKYLMSFPRETGLSGNIHKVKGGMSRMWRAGKAGLHSLWAP